MSSRRALALRRRRLSRPRCPPRSRPRQSRARPPRSDRPAGPQPTPRSPPGPPARTPGRASPSGEYTREFSFLSATRTTVACARGRATSPHGAPPEADRPNPARDRVPSMRPCRFSLADGRSSQTLPASIRTAPPCRPAELATDGQSTTAATRSGRGCFLSRRTHCPEPLDQPSYPEHLYRADGPRTARGLAA